MDTIMEELGDTIDNLMDCTSVCVTNDTTKNVMDPHNDLGVRNLDGDGVPSISGDDLKEDDESAEPVLEKIVKEAFDGKTGPKPVTDEVMESAPQDKNTEPRQSTLAPVLVTEKVMESAPQDENTEPRQSNLAPVVENIVNEVTKNEKVEPKQPIPKPGKLVEQVPQDENIEPQQSTHSPVQEKIVEEVTQDKNKPQEPILPTVSEATQKDSAQLQPKKLIFKPGKVVNQVPQDENIEPPQSTHSPVQEKIVEEVAQDKIKPILSTVNEVTQEDSAQRQPSNLELGLDTTVMEVTQEESAKPLQPNREPVFDTVVNELDQNKIIESQEPIRSHDSTVKVVTQEESAKPQQSIGKSGFEEIVKQVAIDGSPKPEKPICAPAAEEVGSAEPQQPFCKHELKSTVKEVAQDEQAKSLLPIPKTELESAVEDVAQDDNANSQLPIHKTVLESAVKKEATDDKAKTQQSIPKSVDGINKEVSQSPMPQPIREPALGNKVKQVGQDKIPESRQQIPKPIPQKRVKEVAGDESPEREEPIYRPILTSREKKRFKKLRNYGIDTFKFTIEQAMAMDLEKVRREFVERQKGKPNKVVEVAGDKSPEREEPIYIPILTNQEKQRLKNLRNYGIDTFKFTIEQAMAMDLEKIRREFIERQKGKPNKVVEVAGDESPEREEPIYIPILTSQEKKRLKELRNYGIDTFKLTIEQAMAMDLEKIRREFIERQKGKPNKVMEVAQEERPERKEPIFVPLTGRKKRLKKLRAYGIDTWNLPIEELMAMDIEKVRREFLERQKTGNSPEGPASSDVKREKKKKYAPPVFENLNDFHKNSKTYYGFSKSGDSDKNYRTPRTGADEREFDHRSLDSHDSHKGWKKQKTGVGVRNFSVRNPMSDPQPANFGDERDFSYRNPIFDDSQQDCRPPATHMSNFPFRNPKFENSQQDCRPPPNFGDERDFPYRNPMFDNLQQDCRPSATHVGNFPFRNPMFGNSQKDCKPPETHMGNFPFKNPMFDNSQQDCRPPANIGDERDFPFRNPMFDNSQQDCRLPATHMGNFPFRNPMFDNSQQDCKPPANIGDERDFPFRNPMFDNSQQDCRPPATHMGNFPFRNPMFDNSFDECRPPVGERNIPYRNPMFDNSQQDCSTPTTHMGNFLQKNPKFDKLGESNSPYRNPMFDNSLQDCKTTATHASEPNFRYRSPMSHHSFEEYKPETNLAERNSSPMSMSISDQEDCQTQITENDERRIAYQSKMYDNSDEICKKPRINPKDKVLPKSSSMGVAIIHTDLVDRRLADRTTAAADWPEDGIQPRSHLDDRRLDFKIPEFEDRQTSRTDESKRKIDYRIQRADEDKRRVSSKDSFVRVAVINTDGGKRKLEQKTEFGDRRLDYGTIKSDDSLENRKKPRTDFSERRLGYGITEPESKKRRTDLVEGRFTNFDEGCKKTYSDVGEHRIRIPDNLYDSKKRRTEVGNDRFAFSNPIFNNSLADVKKPSSSAYQTPVFVGDLKKPNIPRSENSFGSSTSEIDFKNTNNYRGESNFSYRNPEIDNLPEFSHNPNIDESSLPYRAPEFGDFQKFNPKTKEGKPSPLPKSNSIRVAVIPYDYPERTLTKEQAEQIEEAVANKIDDMDEGPQFEKSRYFIKGYLGFICGNQASKNFLQDFMANECRGSYKVVDMKDLPTRGPQVKAVFHLPKAVDIQTAFLRLEKQNRGLNCGSWNVFSVKTDEECFQMLVGIDDVSVRFIKASECRLWYATTRILVRFIKGKENPEGGPLRVISDEGYSPEKTTGHHW